MIYLKKISGLPLKYDKKLIFGNGLARVKPDIRTLEQMFPVLLDRTISNPKKVYYMYRDAHFPKDKAIMDKYGIRYDVTILPPSMLGEEFVKTLGHYHPIIKGKKVSYPEVYEVLNGTAHYLLQKDNMKDVFTVVAKAGDKVIMPPNYGHITINPGKEPLIMSNWVEKNFKSNYCVYVKKHGGAYYETLDGWIRNRNYRKVPQLRLINPKKISEFGLTSAPMYDSFFKNPEKFRFLAEPWKYTDIFNDFIKQ